MLLAVAAIVTAALCWQGCATRKQTHSQNLEESADSAWMQGTLSGVAVMKEPVHESKATVFMPADSVANMPEGASYTARNGRAQVGVVRKGDRLMAYATCDSLERQVEYYASLSHWYHRMYEASREQQQSHPPDNSRREQWTRLLIGAAFMAIGMRVLAGKIFK